MGGMIIRVRISEGRAQPLDCGPENVEFVRARVICLKTAGSSRSEKSPGR